MAHDKDMRVRRWSLLAAALLALATLAPSQAQPGAPTKIVKAPPPPPLVGLTKLGELRPTDGFVDDGVTAIDGGLIALVHDNHTSAITATTVSTADGAVTSTLELTKVAPAAVRVTPLPDRSLFVLEVVDGKQRGVVVDPTGKKLRAHKPGTNLAVRIVNGKPVIATYTVDPKAKGGEAHAVTVVDARSAKKVPGKPARLLLSGADRRDAKLDFRPIYFIDDMTVAVGVRGGVWRKADDQRGPDTWAAYDLTSSTWVRDEPITDPMGLARRIPILAASSNLRTFARMADDLSALEIWRDGAPTTVTLDQPLDNYDPVAIQYATHGDALWVSLVVDPTNPTAVRRQKADARYLDLFEVQGARAVRRARVLLDKAVPRWGWAGDTLWVLEKHPVLSRGGAAITLYKL